MPLWIPITVAAALFQNIRTTMQQKIRGVLSVDGANFVRYLYGAPLALGMLAFLVVGTGRQVPSLSPGFFALDGCSSRVCVMRRLLTVCVW